MKPLDHLFRPIDIGTMEVRNRIMMAPLSTHWAPDDGHVTQQLIDFYEARATGGVGLIVCEGASPDCDHPYWKRSLGLWSDDVVPSFRRLADAVHAHGAKLAVQLLHPGPDAHSHLKGLRPIGPSAIRCKTNGQISRELAADEIGRIVALFGEAARRAREAGCDAIHLHAAHAYGLLASFLSPLRNKRADAYGGSMEGRMKLVVDVMASMHERAGRDFPIIVRLSADEIVAGGQDLREVEMLAPLLVAAGASALEVSAGALPELDGRVIPYTGTALGLNSRLAAAIKAVVDVPVIVIGRINTPQIAGDILARGQADMVSMARALLADPAWPLKASQGRFDDITPCIGCMAGCRAIEPRTCVVNPAAGRERESAIVAAARSKRVIVVGGGPAGMEAARVASLRGHRVTLFDQASRLGGQMNIATVAPFKQELTLALKHWVSQVGKAGVEVVLGREVTAETVEREAPDVVVVATGGTTAVPRLPGIEGPRVVLAHDVLAGTVPVGGGNILVVGGGLVGCEVADLLAERGDKPPKGWTAVANTSGTAVTIVERLPEIGLDQPPSIRAALLRRFAERDVRMLTSANVISFLDDGALVSIEGREEALRGMDWIVLATGVKAVDSLRTALRQSSIEVHVIGDAKRPRDILAAVAEGGDVGRSI